MLRLLVILTLAAVVAYFGSTVKLGERTFFGHIRAIWSTKETQDMRKGLEEKAGPALDRMKRGVEAGIKAASGDDGGAPAMDAGVSDAPVDGALPEVPSLAPVSEPAAKPANSDTPKKSDKSDKKPAKKDAKKHDTSSLAPSLGPSRSPSLSPSTLFIASASPA